MAGVCKEGEVLHVYKKEVKVEMRDEEVMETYSFHPIFSIHALLLCIPVISTLFLPLLVLPPPCASHH